MDNKVKRMIDYSYFDEKNKENLAFRSCSSDENSNYHKNDQYQFDEEAGKERKFCQLPEENLNINYKQEYKRLFLSNVALLSKKQIKELKGSIQKYMSRISSHYQVFQIDCFLIIYLKQSSPTRSEIIQQLIENKRKRLRRAAEEIDRHYKCPVKTCEKSYGSEGSLHQHLKLKHPEHHVQYLEALINQQLQREKVQKKH